MLPFRRRPVAWLAVAAAGVALWFAAAGRTQPAAAEVELVFSFGSEKESWLKEVTKTFNDSKAKTADGRTIKVTLAPMGSGQCVESVLTGSTKAHITSPASTVFVRLANFEAEERGVVKDKAVITDKAPSLVKSPIVIA